MPEDPTEQIRRALVPLVNEVPVTLLPPPTWTTEELQRDFIVHAFMTPFCIVTEKATGKKGSLLFQHAPRVYFDWTPDE